MKKKNEELTKITMVYDRIALLSAASLFLVTFLCYVFLGSINKSSPPLPNAVTRDFDILILVYLCLIFLISQLRFRTINEKGITASLLGIPYKHIHWSDVTLCTVDLQKSWASGDRHATILRYVILFKSRLNRRYKATIIAIYDTPATRALVEKYYGQIDYENRKDPN